MPSMQVKGIQTKVEIATKMVVPEPVKDEPAPLSATPVIVKPVEPILPEPVLPIPTPKSQDELATISIATQTITNKRAMIPSTEPAKLPITDEQRVIQAKQAIEARWSRKFDWNDSPIDMALEYLAELRLEVEKGGLTLQRRVSEARVEQVKCYSCDNIISISEGRWAGMRTRNNYETGIPESQYACSAACYLRLQRDFIHPTTRTQ